MSVLRTTCVRSKVQSLQQSCKYNALEHGVGVGVCNIDIELLMLLINYEAAPTCHAWFGLGFKGKSLYPTFFMHMMYPVSCH